jgi:hypothetical protein
MSEHKYYDWQGQETSLSALTREQPEWSESRIRSMEQRIAELERQIAAGRKLPEKWRKLGFDEDEFQAFVRCADELEATLAPKDAD